ncbi:MAG: hypothetical protein M1831_006142 [Alyxoria varia]|nr:MAG: hypothetical protein M1831_006142 [Alyxoria varia]
MSGKNLKRAAKEDAFRAHVLEQPSKKTKFDARNPSTLAQEAPDEDAILDLDEIGKGGAQSKRKAVRLEGYESDSSQENFDARADAKAKNKDTKQAGKAEDEDENDMFADLEENLADGDDDEDLAREGKKRKEVRFLNQEDIQGQVSNSTSGGHVSADFTPKSAGNRDEEAESSSDEGEDEERDRIGSDVDEELGAGAKKRQAPKLDAFNVRNEAEEGKFDQNGNFIRNATDPFAVHDSWLEGASKADVKKAREAHEKREDDRRRRNMEDDAVSMKTLLSSLIHNLEDGETVLEGLARLGKGIKKSKPQPKWKKNRQKDESVMDVDDEGEDPEQVKRKKLIEEVTGAADHIMTRGQTEIYDAERTLLIRQYRRETGEDWVDHPESTSDFANGHDERQWEYRWSDARDGGQTHGPYDGRTMSAWISAGYFGKGVEFRELGGGDDDWSRVADFT